MRHDSCSLQRFTDLTCHGLIKHNSAMESVIHMFKEGSAIRHEEWIKKAGKAGRWPSNPVINGDGEIVDARMRAGLQPTPLTRDLKWGVPVPIDSEEDEPMKGKVLCKCAF